MLLRFLIFVLCLSACKKSEQTQPVSPLPSSSSKTSNFSCIGKVKNVEVQYEASYIILESAIPRNSDGSRNDLYFNNVFYYGSMFLPFSFDFINESSGAKYMSLYPDTATWKDIEVSDATYPYDVNQITVLDEDLRFFPKTMIDYYKNFQNTGAKKGDKAVAIKAKVSLKAFFCMDGSAPPLNSDQIKFYMPIDPQTAFEVIPKNEWREISHARNGKKFVSNPCIDPEGVAVSETRSHMYNNLFYYFWHPTHKGMDTANKPFDCSDWYKEGVHYQVLKVNVFDNEEIKSKKLPFKEIVAPKKPVDIMIALGFTKNPHIKINAEWFKSVFNKIFTAQKKEFDQLLPRFDEESTQDLSIDKLMILLWRLKDQLLIEKNDLVVDGDIIQIKISGKFKLSKLPINLTLFLGTIKNDMPRFNETRVAFANGMIGSDIFIYNGHASFGESLSPNTLDLKTMVDNYKGEVPKNQIIALFSCQAFFSYEPGKFSALPSIETRGWIHSLGNYKEISSNGTLGVLASLDQAALNGNYVAFDKWTKVFANDNFLMRTVIENESKP